jgi:purine-nucleoside phosphorylase
MIIRRIAMGTIYNKAKEAADFIKSKLSKDYKIALILGSGLGGVSDELKNSITIKYTDIPNMPKSTAMGHKGEFVFGELHGRNVVVMNGRLHYYEGYSMQDITLPIRIFKLLNIETLVITNAAGGINSSFDRGDIMIINDHINFMGDNPLIGENEEEFGPRFPDMSEPYYLPYIDTVKNIAKQLGYEDKIKEGVYIAFTGPSFETKAELKFAKIAGADTVGMSTVPEVIVANHSGIKVLGLSVVTDIADPDREIKSVSGEEVIEVAKKASKLLESLVNEFVKGL